MHLFHLYDAKNAAHVRISCWNIFHVLWKTAEKCKCVWRCGMSSDVTWSKVVCSERRINSKYCSLWESYKPQLAVFLV